MKKAVFSVLCSTALLALALLAGCKSAGTNPAGVYGAGGAFDSMGTIPLADRFTGGTEHPGMFPPVYFSFDSSQLAPSERAKVEAVASYLKQNPNTALIIEGHTDERGSREYNLALGERRALSVRAYITNLGISENRIQTKSFGEEKPVVPQHEEAAWSKNRRGEFVLYY